MRDLSLYCTIILVSIACNTDKGNTQNIQSKSGYTLEANRGLTDSAAMSFVDVYNTASFIHGDPKGYFLCYFHDSAYHQHYTMNDSGYFPQLSLHLNNIQSRMFSVTINFVQVNLNKNDNGKIFFVRSNYNEKPDTPYKLIDVNTRQVTIDSLIPSLSHSYILNVFGLFTNPNMWFTVSDININYQDSLTK